MPFTRIDAHDDPSAIHQGPGVVVCIPLHGAHDLFVRCLRSVLAHTPTDVPVLVADDHGPDPASEAWVREIEARGELRHRIAWLRQPENLGFVGNCNAAFAVTGRADVVLVNSDVEVSAGWIEGMRDAARDDAVATVTALTNDGTIVSVPHRNNPQPDFPSGLTFDQSAARVREASERIRPEIPTAVGHCVLITRAALDLVGGFDVSFSPAYGEEVDFSQRCVLAGLRNVVADDVLVLHHGRGSMGVEGERNPIQDRHERIIRSRYPFYPAAVAAVERADGPLARAVTIAGQALLGPSVTIDGRCLTRTMTGTQVHTLEVLSALWRRGDLRLRVVVPPDLGDVAGEALARMPEVQVVTTEDALRGVRLDDLVHRPFHITDPEDARFLHLLGHRVVVTHHDLIAYRNPGYFPGSRAWQRYRRITRETMALADRVVFVSDHAEAEARREGLITGTHTAVAPNGVDHSFEGHVGAPAPPPGGEDLPGREFLLVLGTDFRHKNRRFALRLFRELRERHGWNGRLVLAGHRVSHGSSAGDEDEWLALNTGLAADVVRLPAVDEAAKDWLMSHAAALLYPTTYEGFGLPPFEAADAGLPCLFAPVSALREVLDGATPTLVPWDPRASAELVMPVLADPARRRTMAEEIRAIGATYTWDAAAERLQAAYRETLRTPPRSAQVLVGDSLTADARYWGLRTDIGPTGLSLVDPQQPLLPESAQRTIAALARRRLTRRPFLAVLSSAQRATRRSRDDAEAPDASLGHHDELPPGVERNDLDRTRE